MQVRGETGALSGSLRRIDGILPETAARFTQYAKKLAGERHRSPLAARYINPFPGPGEKPLQALGGLPLVDTVPCPLCRLLLQETSCRTHLNSKHKGDPKLMDARKTLKDSTIIKAQNAVFWEEQAILPGLHM